MKKTICIAAIRKEAEELYRNHDFYCSEAIASTIRRQIEPEMPAEAIAMASGFPVGVGGALCMCGAVSGGIMCLGYFFGRTQPKDDKVNKAMALSKELYDAFTGNHKVACCKILTKGMELGSPVHMEQCISFTGEVAAKTAEIIARELNIKIEQ
ncbi:MAG: C-GCAxxG-C-C family protein [Spirochaetaceae bacterium]|jgi:C_GCAxxG_C_C family probable redox protein|nr:C-GCAxxG-C-C family protein [Spirochaetaceae bacterium]